MKTALALALVLVAGVAHADPDSRACPTAITDAAAAAVPGSTVTRCHTQRKHATYEAKITKPNGGKAEVELAADGTVLEVETVIPLGQVVEPVMTAFAAKFPKGKAKKAEKSVRPGQQDVYELAFTLAGARREASFLADGTFVEDDD
jgi:hypothetical protein